MIQIACFSSCPRDLEPAGHFQPNLRQQNRVPREHDGHAEEMVVNPHQPGEPESRRTSLSEFFHSGKASVEPCTSKQQSNLMGQQIWLGSLLRDAHTLQLQLNSVKSQSTKRQASIGKQALLVGLLVELLAY